MTEEIRTKRKHRIPSYHICRTIEMVREERKGCPQRGRKGWNRIRKWMGGIKYIEGSVLADLKQLPHREWSHAEKWKLRKEMGFNAKQYTRLWDEAQKVITFMRARKHPDFKKRDLGQGSRQQRLEFLKFWLRKVRERGGYRWERITFRI